MERNYNRKENGGNRKPAGRNFYKGNYGGNFSNEKRERQDGEKRERKTYEREHFSSERRVSAENKETSRESAPRFRKRERIGGNDRRESREYVKKDYPELIVKPFRHNITREMAVIYSRERYLSCAVKEAVRFTLDYFSNAENELVRRKPD